MEMRTMCSESVHGDKKGTGQHSIDTTPEKTAREYKVERHGAIRGFQLDPFACPYCIALKLKALWMTSPLPLVNGTRNWQVLQGGS